MASFNAPGAYPETPAGALADRELGTVGAVHSSETGHLHHGLHKADGSLGENGSLPASDSRLTSAIASASGEDHPDQNFVGLHKDDNTSAPQPAFSSGDDATHSQRPQGIDAVTVPITSEPQASHKLGAETSNDRFLGLTQATSGPTDASEQQSFASGIGGTMPSSQSAVATPGWSNLPTSTTGGVYNTVTGHGSTEDSHEHHFSTASEPAAAGSTTTFANDPTGTDHREFPLTSSSGGLSGSPSYSQAPTTQQGYDTSAPIQSSSHAANVSTLAARSAFASSEQRSHAQHADATSPADIRHDQHDATTQSHKSSGLLGMLSSHKDNQDHVKHETHATASNTHEPSTTQKIKDTLLGAVGAGDSKHEHNHHDTHSTGVEARQGLAAGTQPSHHHSQLPIADSQHPTSQAESLTAPHGGFFSHHSQTQQPSSSILPSGSSTGVPFETPARDSLSGTGTGIGAGTATGAGIGTGLGAGSGVGSFELVERRRDNGNVSSHLSSSSAVPDGAPTTSYQSQPVMTTGLTSSNIPSKMSTTSHSQDGTHHSTHTSEAIGAGAGMAATGLAADHYQHSAEPRSSYEPSAGPTSSYEPSYGARAPGETTSQPTGSHEYRQLQSGTASGVPIADEPKGNVDLKENSGYRYLPSGTPSGIAIPEAERQSAAHDSMASQAAAAKTSHRRDQSPSSTMAAVGVPAMSASSAAAAAPPVARDSGHLNTSQPTTSSLTTDGPKTYAYDDLPASSTIPLASSHHGIGASQTSTSTSTSMGPITHTCKTCGAENDISDKFTAENLARLGRKI